MMLRYKLTILSLFFCGLLTVCSQEISVGYYSGINYSDIHGNQDLGKWSYKPGPVQGIYLGYSFNSFLGLESGVGLTTIYYEHKTNSRMIDYWAMLSSSIVPEYYSGTSRMDYSFVRLPLLFNLSVPAVPQLDLKAGVYYSFIYDYTLNNAYFFQDPRLVKNDYGLIFSSGISYPFTESFNASLRVSYVTGKKPVFEGSEYRHGSSEFALGVAYTGFLKRKNSLPAEHQTADTSEGRFSYTFKGGIDVSWNSGSRDEGKYSYSNGPSVGLSVDYMAANRFSLRSGFSFERKGYSLEDSSSLYYRYFKRNRSAYYVDTNIELDYLVIPLLLNFYAGKSNHIFFNTGPYLGLKLNARCVGESYHEIHSEYEFSLVQTHIYDDIDNLIRDYDLGWIFGGGVAIPLKNNYKIELALQYSTGFVDVLDSEAYMDIKDERTSGTVIKNGSVSLMVGFRIPQSVY